MAGRPKDVAPLKAEIESFFVLGATRIEMIAKVMDLDNAIGGHNFDIPLLGDTEKAIEDLSKPKGIRGCIFCIKIFAVCLFQGKMGNELNLVRTIGRNLEKSRKEQGGCDSTQCCCFFFFLFWF